MGFIDTEHQGGWSMWGSKTAHLMVAGRERERERERELRERERKRQRQRQGWGQDIVPRACHQGPTPFT
jgi:hypothetical protein